MRAKGPTAAPLEPAACYLLMTGTFCQRWLPGWARLHWAMQPYNHDPVSWRDGVWNDQIAAWLEAEGGAYGFRPWGLTGRGPRPRGAKVETWVRHFLSEHERPAVQPASRPEP